MTVTAILWKRKLLLHAPIIENNFEDTITIQSDQFSTYALVYQDVKQGEEVNSYVIKATVGEHGNISPRDMVKVSEGKHQVFTFNLIRDIN